MTITGRFSDGEVGAFRFAVSYYKVSISTRIQFYFRLDTCYNR